MQNKLILIGLILTMSIGILSFTGCSKGETEQEKYYRIQNEEREKAKKDIEKNFGTTSKEDLENALKIKK